VLLKRLEGSDVIPELAEGVVEEEVDSRTWIKQKALGKREGIWKGETAYFEKDRSTDRVGERSVVV